MAIGWYLKRLANMSPREMVHRAGEARRKQLSRKTSYGWDAFPSRGSLRCLTGLELRVASASPELKAHIRASADHLLEGSFSAHGVAWPKRAPDSLFPPSLWRLDPITGGDWPGGETYCFDIPYRHERERGDAKYVWDLNRLQFLQPLAAAVAIWNDENALRAIEQAIASWAEANPPFQGLGWNSGIELAMRAVSLIVAMSLCGGRLQEQTLAITEGLLRAHHFWLRRYPSRFSSANNHLVAEALGEFAIELVLPELRGDDRSRETLEREARLQILADGVGAEQSPTYAAFTAEMLLVADLLARAAGQAPLSPSAHQRLASFARWISWISDERGRAPNIGDDDGGCVLSLCMARETAYPTSVARAVAGWLDIASNVAASADPPQLRDALFAAKSGDNAPTGVKTFAEGGYTVVREQRAGKNVCFVLDHGPLGYLSIAAHGHADANAFTLCLDDEPVFVDPGTYLYHSGAGWRDWFRGTKAHNTLCLDGTDQSVISGPFNWGAKAQARLGASIGGKEWMLSASHDGYKSRFGVEHVRQVRALPNGIALLDRLTGAAVKETAEITFQAAPGLAIRLENGGWVVFKKERPVLRLAFSSRGETFVVRGGALGEGGWVSPCFGGKVAADQLVWRGVVPEHGLITAIEWGAAAEQEPMQEAFSEA